MTSGSDQPASEARDEAGAMVAKISTSNLALVLREALGSNSGPCFLVSPFVTAEGLNAIVPSDGAQTLLLTSWRADHLRAGIADLSLYPYCKDHGISLHVLDTLHAKFYSRGLQSAWLGSANLTSTALGLSSAPNDEILALLDPVPASVRVWLHGLLGKATLVTDNVYEWYRAWVREFTDVGRPPKRERPPMALLDPYLLSRLPATISTHRLMALMLDPENCDDDDEMHALEHDLGLFGLVPCESLDELHAQLRPKFAANPFAAKLERDLPPDGMRFGQVKQWLQDTCTDVPVPYRRDLTWRVRTIYNWLTELWPDRYLVHVPGAHSEVLVRRRLSGGQVSHG